MSALLHVVGEGADHQIATEAQRWLPAIHPPPRKPQLGCGSLRQSGGLAFGGRLGAWQPIAPAVSLTDEAQRLARIPASRCIVGCGSHAVARSAMR
jgi:hypothetical protein